MSIKLAKGVTIRLKKDSDIMKKCQINLFWNIKKGSDVDVDLSCVGYSVDSNNVESLYNEDYFMFYNHHNKEDRPDHKLITNDCAIEHTGDERVQGGESVLMDFTKVPIGVAGIAIFLTIHKAIEHRVHFGVVESASCQIVNSVTNDELAEYNLKEKI